MTGPRPAAIRVVTPYRPFVPESEAHQQLGPFDWVGAIEMLRVSVTEAMGCETVTITDVDTTVPGPMRQYDTRERRLMLWILEVALCYLRSPAFAVNTIMLSPDLLVFGDLRPWMTDQFTILMRSRYPTHPILNAVQFWPVQQKTRLIDFYERALVLGRTLDEAQLRWGADTEPLRQLLAPLTPGLVWRGGEPVARLLEADEILQAFTSRMATDLTESDHVARPARAILDFRYVRKRYMRAYFERTLGALAWPA